MRGDRWTMSDDNIAVGGANRRAAHGQASDASRYTRIAGRLRVLVCKGEGDTTLRESEGHFRKDLGDCMFGLGAVCSG